MALFFRNLSRRRILQKTENQYPTHESNKNASQKKIIEKLILLKPQTYMNNSGHAILSIKSSLKLGKESLLVISDDIDIPFGTLKLRGSGGAGSHNGLKSIVSSIGKEFIWLRLGIGSDEMPKDNLDKFVLQNFTEEEFRKLENYLDSGVKAIFSLIENGLSATMNTYNGKSFV